MANKNGRGKTWSANNILFLVENWRKLTTEQLSQKLNRSESAIKQKAFMLRLPKKPRRNATPPERVEYIRSNAGKMTVKEIAAYINCPPATIYTIGRKHKISFKGK